MTVLKAKVNGVWVPVSSGSSSSGGGGGGTDEVWVGPDTPADAATELWYDTDEPNTAASYAATAWSGWTFPPSLALTQNSFTGLFPSGEAGNAAEFLVVSLARPAGWAGPDPLRAIRLTVPGIYHLSGSLSLGTMVASEGGFTFLNFCKTDGSGVTEGTDLHTGSSHGPFMYNTYAKFDTTFQTLVPDVCVRFCIYVNVAGISTWSAPGRFSLWRVG